MVEKLLRGLVPRRYQEAIFAQAAEKNTLVVLPTGLGKTAIAAMLAIHRLAMYPTGKVVVLAPTRPLVLQHRATFADLLTLGPERLAAFTGTVPPAARREAWGGATIIFSTPQGLENDVLSAKIPLADVVLMVFDEAHRAVGDYSYVYLAKHYLRTASHPHVIGLTASPGSDPAVIQEVCQNLGIEHLESRQEADADVAPYTHPLDLRWISVELPPALRAVRDLLASAYLAKLDEVKALGFLDGEPKRQTKTTLLKLTGALHGRLAQGERDFRLLKAISLVAEALKIQHAVELAETQGVHACRAYLLRLAQMAQTSTVKAVKHVAADERVRAAGAMLDKLAAEGVEHPKLAAAIDLVTARLAKAPAQKFIVFTQYRDQAELLVRRLRGVNVACELFVGQAKKGDTGMSQKTQAAVLDRFRAGGFACLVATSVAEEGLDIPAVDTVIFYEPIPSAIRTVQRKGRTARHAQGEALILVTKDSRDEGYRWSAHHKEKRMVRTIRTMAGVLPGPPPTLAPYLPKTGLAIVADYREKGGPVLKELAEAGVALELARLPAGDFRVTDDVVVEYKTIADFVDSVVDGRLLAQVRMLRAHYSPLLILEGTEDLYGLRKVAPNALRGMLLTILFKFRIPILWTRSPKDTAAHLIALAKLYQDPDRPVPHLHFAKPRTLAEQQEYAVAAWPGLGPQLAKALLTRFGSLACLMAATPGELASVEKIGPKTAESLHAFLHAHYALRSEADGARPDTPAASSAQVHSPADGKP